MPDATHAKKALTATLGKRETAGTPSYYVDEDYPAEAEIQ